MMLALSWDRAGPAVRLHVRGAPPAAQLAVYPAKALEAGLEGILPVAGRFATGGGLVVFTPRWPLLPGTAYAVTCEVPGGERYSAQIQLPGEPASAETTVEAVYPTALVLPVNHLRFYVHFSAPMSEGRAGRCIRLRDAATGEPLEDALLPMEVELWDPARRRLTVLLDPARIKRGLVANLERGYPLAEGRGIVFEVDAAFPDARGAPLSAGFSRRYEVGPAIGTRLDPARWPLTVSAPGTREPAEVSFDRPLDHALALRCIRIEAPGGGTVQGETSMGPGETSWRFTPQEPWNSGLHTLVVGPALEDCAGNTIARPFDRDLDDEGGPQAPPGGVLRLPLR